MLRAKLIFIGQHTLNIGLTSMSFLLHYYYVGLCCRPIIRMDPQQLFRTAAGRFGVDELREHQLTVCLDYYRGKDSFLIAPTGKITTSRSLIIFGEALDSAVQRDLF